MFKEGLGVSGTECLPEEKRQYLFNGNPSALNDPVKRIRLTSKCVTHELLFYRKQAGLINVCFKTIAAQKWHSRNITATSCFSGHTFDSILTLHQFTSSLKKSTLHTVWVRVTVKELWFCRTVFVEFPK